MMTGANRCSNVALIILTIVALEFVSPSRANDGLNQQNSPGAVSFLLAEPTDKLLNRSSSVDRTLNDVLSRYGPDMKVASDYRDEPDLSLEVAQRAWRLLHQHAQVAMDQRIRVMRPIVERIIMEANVSQSCQSAVGKTMDAAQRLEWWATQLLTSWGSFPPTGIFEGTFGDIGSYNGCINVPENVAIGHAHYCSISYRPVMPKRRDYELVLRQEPEELLNVLRSGNKNKSISPELRSPDESALSELLRHSQYNHFIYYKLGACFPIKCSPLDVQRLARLLGRRAILMSGPVKCHSKFSEDYKQDLDSKQQVLRLSAKNVNNGIYIWRPHVTNTQLVAVSFIILLATVIASATILDLCLYRLPKAYLKFVNNFMLTNESNGPSSGEIIEDFAMKRRTPSPQKLDLLDEIDPNNNMTLTDLGDFKSLEQNHQDLARREKTNGRRDSVDGFKTIPLNESEELKQQVAELDANKELNSADKRSLSRQLIEDCSLITNVRQFFEVDESQVKRDISCINGIRSITMSWIIITHTMQYNDWSAFARIWEIETHLSSLINQPLFNGSYLVDTFFLVSGLLTSYSSFRPKKRRSPPTRQSPTINHQDTDEQQVDFSVKSYLIGRYLRLTPQVLFVAMLFIVLPLMSANGGPHWYSMTGEYSENCSKNWWTSLFYIQAIYQPNEMCNFASWWISVDMMYHLFALLLILAILRWGRSVSFLGSLAIILSHALVQATRHFAASLPPNLLSSIPQTGAMWSKMTLDMFWTPFAHATPFFLGFYLGHLLASRPEVISSRLTFRRATFGWLLAVTLLVSQSYSTYFWVVGRWSYSRLSSTLFHVTAPLVWSSCLAWIIVACHYNFGGFVNRFLSCRLFVVLARASYIVYLSHFIILFTFFGSQNLLLEPTQSVMSYVIVGNICLSMIFGSILCICFEMPWLKMQKRIMKKVN